MSIKLQSTVKANSLRRDRGAPLEKTTAFPKMVHPAKRARCRAGSRRWQWCSGVAWSPGSWLDEHSHQRRSRQPQPVLMLTRLECTELTFESDQMISMHYLGRTSETV